MNHRSLRRVLLTSLLAATPAGLIGCGADDENSTDGAAATVSEETASKAIANYSAIVHQSYVDSLEAAEALDEASRALVDDPSQDTLDAARAAWLASREPCLQTEVYRFYEGPIDNEEDGPEGMLNAWPLDEAYIDYVEGDDASGIVGDTEVEITAEALAELNEQGGEKNIATGYHAVEFLLWGQDFSDDGPGDRPFEDYVDAPNADRRATYLTTASGLIVEKLESLAFAWAPGEDNYRAELSEVSVEEGLRRILTGMIALSGFETGGERLQTALDSGDQEDEHSCFSDNTHRDMVQDVRGVQNVYLGRYEAVDGSVIEGVGIKEVVLEVEPELAEELEQQIATSLELAEALQPPFDQEIASDNTAGRDRVAALVSSLRAQENLLEDVFQALGLSVPVVE